MALKHGQQILETFLEALTGVSTSVPDCISYFKREELPYPKLLDGSLINLHYGPQTLWSKAARQGWIEAELKLLPMPRTELGL